MLKPSLYTFMTVSEKGSFTKAASSLFITPSAVIQQINSLENDLSATLFTRTPKGVRLTPAGEYLYENVKELLQKSAFVRRQLSAYSASGNEICVGISMLEKCRLLYDLWVLFAEQEKNYSIRMVNISPGHQIPDQADLIESVHGNVPWTKDFEFKEVCQVPFGFAFTQDHPLAKKETIHPEDLSGETVVSLNKGTSDQISGMLSALGSAGVKLLYRDTADSSTLWECAFHHYTIVCPLCWEDILIGMTMRPCAWNHSMPYGFFYRPSPSPASQKFLDFIRQTYKGQDPKETVWTL